MLTHTDDELIKQSKVSYQFDFWTWKHLGMSGLEISLQASKSMNVRAFLQTFPIIYLLDRTIMLTNLKFRSADQIAVSDTWLSHAWMFLYDLRNYLRCNSSKLSWYILRGIAVILTSRWFWNMEEQHKRRHMGYISSNFIMLGRI